MIQRVGIEALDDIEAYLASYPHETVFARSDLLAWQRNGRAGGFPALWGYRCGGDLVAVQAIHPGGRWLPHLADDGVLDALLDDALPRHPRWTLGVRRVMDRVVERVVARGRRATYDEIEHLYYLDHSPPAHRSSAKVRRARQADARAIAGMRCEFEREYFCLRSSPVSSAWCLQVAQRYVTDGAYVAECDGRLVAMAAVEADVPELAIIGAVYTRPAYRGQGFAHSVVSAVCADLLRHKPRVALTVRPTNKPAQRVYDSLGFRYWDEYRMCRFT